MEAFDPATKFGVRFEMSPRVPIAGQSVRWQFTVTNQTSGPRALTFESAQRGDVVLMSAGSEYYRWSRGKLFAAVVSSLDLAADEEWEFSLEDILSVGPGTYALFATVIADPRPPPIDGEILVSGS